MTGPGFLQTYTEKYTRQLNSKTVVIFDEFLNDDLIVKLQAAGIRNLIITNITDYMSTIVKEKARKKRGFSNLDFLDEYVRLHKTIPLGMEIIRLKDFVKIGTETKHTYNFEYEENKRL